MTERVKLSEINQHFEPSERLFRRVPLVDVENGFLSNASIPLPVFSTDRESYLVEGIAGIFRKYPEMGLAWFCVGDIPATLTSEDGRRYDFCVEHRPENDNPAHSEVHSYRDGTESSGLPNGVKKKFRDALRLKIPPHQMTMRMGSSFP